MEPNYPIRAAAKLTGLSIDTLRAWERRYKAVVPARSDRGRQYSQEQIQHLVLLRELVDRGHSIGQIAPLEEPRLRQLLNTQPPSERKAPGASGELVSSLLDAFERFEHLEANDELGRLAVLLSPRDLIYRVVLPLMHEVGERWHDKKIGIAQEHLVSSAMRNLFGALVRLHPPRPNATKMLIATLSDELHEFGILAAAMIASISGLNPILLGPNLPARELADAAVKTAAPIVLVGASGATPPDSGILTELAGWLPASTELWVGGRHTSQAEESGGDVPIVFFADMQAFEERCRRRAVQ